MTPSKLTLLAALIELGTRGCTLTWSMTRTLGDCQVAPRPRCAGALRCEITLGGRGTGRP